VVCEGLIFQGKHGLTTADLVTRGLEARVKAVLVVMKIYFINRLLSRPVKRLWMEKLY
jgi:hypothetical protein